MRNEMDLKIILLLCVVVAVTASELHQNAERKSRSRQAARPPIDPIARARARKAAKRTVEEEEWKKTVTFSDEVEIIWRRSCYNPAYDLPGGYYGLHGINPRERKHGKQERAKKNRSFKETLQEVQASFNGFMNSLEAERTPEEVKESALNMMFDVFMGWQNATSKVDNVDIEETGISSRILQEARGEQSELGKISSFCGFLSILAGFMDQCKGREKECIQSLAQMMTEQQQMEEPMKRVGNPHQPVLEAVKELADRLEQSRDPDDQNMALLANALLKLYNDVQAHKATVEANVIVILDVYNILQKLDSCAQNPQCCDDWYSAYDKLQL